MKWFKVFLLVAFLLNISFIRAQNTAGTDFWLTFGENNSTPSVLQIRVVGGDNPTLGTIYFTNLGTSINFYVPAQQVYTYTLNDAQIQAAINVVMGKTNHSIRITTDKPVGVYAMNQVLHSNDVTNILPVTALGTEYYHISYTPNLNPDTYAVVATQNNTNLYHENILVATLNSGEVYFRSDDNSMTGTYITADRPVAFFSLSKGVLIPASFTASDCLMQQLAPMKTWGKKFFVPVSHLIRDIVRIVASEDNTNITQIGGKLLYSTGSQSSLTNLKAGQFVELEVSLSNNGCYIQSDKPVGVCTFLTGCTYNSSSTSDPSQCWLPSIAQTDTGALISPFFPSINTVSYKHYALIITPTADKEDTKFSVGGGALEPLSGGSWRDNTAAGMSFYSMPLVNNTASYYITNQKGIIVLCYGAGYAESYYFLGSSAMRSLNVTFYANDLNYLNLPFHTFCVNDIIFRAEVNGLNPNPGHLKWFIDGIEEISARDLLIWDKNFPTGEYEITMKVKYIDGDSATLETILNIGAEILVTASPTEGGKVTGEGCYLAGKLANLTAKPNYEYEFTGWTENNTPVSTSETYSFTVTEPRTLVANFRKITYSVTVDVSNSDYGDATGAGVYEINTPVQVEALVNDCYRFTYWTIDGVVGPTNNPYVFTATKNVSLVANFSVLDFDTYAPILWDNTFMLNLKKLREDGYEYTHCLWYKNGIEEKDTRTINEFSYSAGPYEGDLLELSPTYYKFELITKNLGNLCSSKKMIDSYIFKAGLLAYPNPVLAGSMLTVTGFTPNNPIYIYNQYGACVGSSIATENNTTLTLNYPPGIYLVRSNNKTTKILIMK
jgi:hypothetical protein